LTLDAPRSLDQVTELADAWRNFVDILGYEDAFEHLSTEDAVEALLARSLLEQYLGGASEVSPELLSGIRSSDHGFRELAARLLENTKVALYSDRADDPSHWWWRLEELVLGERGEALVSVPEAAEIKGVHPHTVRKAIHLGLLPARRLARGFLMRRGDLERWEPSSVGRPKRHGPADRLLEAFNEANTTGNWPRAHSIAAELMRDASSPRRRLAVAIDQFNAGSFEAAIKWSREVIEDSSSGPSAEIARIVAGRAHLALNRGAEAAVLLAEAKSPPELRWLRDVALAEAYLAAGRPRQALGVSTHIVADRAEVLFVRARMEWHCNRIWSALESIVQFRTTRPDDLDGLMLHGAILGHVGDLASDRRAYATAYLLFRRVLRDTRSPDVYRLYGLTAARLGWWSRVRETVEYLRGFGDEGTEAAQMIADAWLAFAGTNESPKLAAQLDFLVACVGDSPGIRRERALQLIGSYAPLAEIEEAVSRANLPTDQEAVLRAIALASRGDPASALNLVRPLAPNAPSAVLLTIARIALQVGNVDAARDALRSLERDDGPLARAATIALEFASASVAEARAGAGVTFEVREYALADEPVASLWEGSFHPAASRIVMRVSAAPALIH
jgi:Flp pilus assembly protein TadD